MRKFIKKQQTKLVQNRLSLIKIEGTIAALKEFISAREVFFNKDLYSGMENFQNKKLVILDKYDVSAIGVFDLMHNDENGPYFDDLDSQDFADVVTRILNDNNFEISIKTVKTINDNTTLRLKHANSDFSANFKDAIVGNQQPVVLAHGIHSNLFTWNDFAEDLATDPKNARDAWLIEMYGGPTTECDTCPVYSFSDLTEFYWPSLMAGVQHYSGQNNLSYVGYDLGCTVALESLENHSGGTNNIGYYFDTTTGDYNYAEPMDLSASPIDTFVGVACIGNFTKVPASGGQPHLARVTEFLNITYNTARPSLNNHFNALELKYKILMKTLPTEIEDIILNLFTNPQEAKRDIIKSVMLAIFAEDFTFIGNPISIYVYDNIIDRINNPSNYKVGQDVSINNFAVIESRKGINLDSFGLIPDNFNTDDFVSISDQQGICRNVDSNNKIYLSFFDLNHFRGPFYPLTNSISDEGKVHEIIIDYLGDNNIEGSNMQYVKSTSGGCD